MMSVSKAVSVLGVGLLGQEVRDMATLESCVTGVRFINLGGRVTAAKVSSASYCELFKNYPLYLRVCRLQ
jgi:hypothetical protein